MQGWSLERKILVSQTRILEWYQKNNGQVYVSFSGGKDSTVLADLAAGVCKVGGYKLTLWFSNTGLEYPEVVSHVKTFPEYLKSKYGIDVELVMDYPKDRKGNRITFRQVLEKYGYPIISKDVANKVRGAKPGNTRWKQLQGVYINPKTGELSSCFNCAKYKYLLSADFKISEQCCEVMKKRPSRDYGRRTGKKPILGLMAEESMKRKMDYIKTGCNAFDKQHPQSQPMGFWMTQDVLEYLYKSNLPYPAVYGQIAIDTKGNYYTTGVNRTGCIFCGFGCHLEKEPNRFQRLKVTHPKLWEYCMKPWTEGGLGMREVLEYIGVRVE